MSDKERCYIPRRYVFLLLAFFGMFNLLATRVSINMTMVVMVNRSAVHHSDNDQALSECPAANQSRVLEATSGTGVKYNWDTNSQGLILGAVYYGILFTQLPGAVLSERFGAKWITGGAVLVSAILTLLTPLTASWGVYPMVTLRVLQGIPQGIIFPAINVMIAKWSHKLERSRFVSIIHSGYHIGVVVSMALTGWLSSMDTLGGWPSTFYVFGISGCIWFIFWATLVHESPEEHPNISEEELAYLEACNEIPKEKQGTPWKAILTSVPVWAALIADSGHEIALVLFMTEIPMYLSSVFHFNILHDGLISALGSVLQAVFAWLSSYVADFLRQSNQLSITNIRKLFTSVALFGPAVCLLGVTLAGCNFQLIIGLITLSRALNGLIYPGAGTIPIDLSPAFAGTINAIIYSVDSICGIVGPSIVGAIMIDRSTVAKWNCVFYMIAACQVLSGLFFVAFSSAELQPWGGSDFVLSRKENSPDRIATIDGVVLKIQSSACLTEPCTDWKKSNQNRMTQFISSIIPIRTRKIIFEEQKADPILPKKF